MKFAHTTLEEFEFDAIFVKNLLKAFTICSLSVNIVLSIKIESIFEFELSFLVFRLFL